MYVYYISSPPTSLIVTEVSNQVELTDESSKAGCWEDEALVYHIIVCVLTI